MEQIGKALMLDEDKVFLKLYRHFLATKGYNVFTTDNPYRMLLFGREIQPDVVFMDAGLPHRNHWEFLKKICAEPWMENVPVILMSSDSLAEDDEIKGISNVVEKKNAIEKIVELLETYCRGGQDHDIFIIADYAPGFETELIRLHSRQRRYFIAHDLKGTRKYLSKNKPRKIAVKYTAGRFDRIKSKLPRESVYRVDTVPEIEKLAEDIK